MEQESCRPDPSAGAQSRRIAVIAVGGAEDGDVFRDDKVAGDDQLLPIGTFQVRKEIANRFLGTDVGGEDHPGGGHKER
jgi:hypothetical protein